MKSFLLFASMLVAFDCYAQLPLVEVADLTLKVGGLSTEELYYGFAEGDEIIFSFEEVKGKELKEIEITELPSNSKFMDFKTKLISGKRIKVRKTSVYKFSFRNTAVSGRICKVKIERVPASEELAHFITDWEWKTVLDTTWVPYTQDSLVGYDTLRYKETVKELKSKETVDDLIMDKSQRVHSYYNANSSKTYLKIDLPTFKKEKYYEEEIIAWAYWIGVGEEANEAYQKNVEAMGQLASGVASTFGTPLAGIAVGAITELFTPSMGEDVAYWFVNDFAYVQAFLAGQEFYLFDQGKGVVAYGKNTNQLAGTFFILLKNDNEVTGIDVNVKVDVIKEIRTYHDVEYDREKVTPRYVTLNKSRMEVSESEVRMNVEQ